MTGCSAKQGRSSENVVSACTLWISEQLNRLGQSGALTCCLCMFRAAEHTGVKRGRHHVCP